MEIKRQAQHTDAVAMSSDYENFQCHSPFPYLPHKRLQAFWAATPGPKYWVEHVQFLSLNIPPSEALGNFQNNFQGERIFHKQKKISKHTRKLDTMRQN